MKKITKQKINKKKKKNKLKYPILCYDVFFKSIFINQENLLAKMVSDITDIDYKILENNIILEINELPVRTNREKAKKCDFVLRIGKDNIINLELNLKSYSGLIVKNLSYIFHLFSTSTKRGEEYEDDLIIFQINLNCFKEIEDNIPLKKYSLREETTNKLYLKNIGIYDLNVVKCHELYYNEPNKDKLPNYIKWGALIYSKDIRAMSSIMDSFLSKKEKDIIMAGLDKLTHDDLFYTEKEAQEWEEWERKSIETYIRKKAQKEGLEQGIEQGIEQGLEQGVEIGLEQKTKEIIISMINNNISIELISKVTNKTKEEINKIINNQ